MKVQLLKFMQIFVGIAALLVFRPVTWAETQVDAEISRVGDASHLELKGLNQWKYDLRRDGDKVVLRVHPLTAKSIAHLRTHTDSLLQGVEVNETGIDGMNEVTFKLKNADVDFFDYQTEEPSKLIVDFFPRDEKAPKKSEKLVETKSRRTLDIVDAVDLAGTDAAAPAPAPKDKTGESHITQPPQLPAKRSKETKGTAGDSDTSSRQPAATEFLQIPSAEGSTQLIPSDKVGTGEIFDTGGDGFGATKDFRHGIFDGSDPEFRRFQLGEYQVRESAMIASRRNLYLRFPSLKLGSPHLAILLKNPPIYGIIPGKDQENKEAQLLLTLFNNNRRAVFLKSAKDFLEKYPETKYHEIISYMMADTYYGLWAETHKPVDFEAAMGLYRHLSERYPESPLTTRTLLLMGYSHVDRGDSFGAIKALQRFLRFKGQTKFTDQVKISIAEAYLTMSRNEDALALLDEVERTAPAKSDALEGAFRKGDIFFHRRLFKDAVKHYKEAIQKYPAALDRFPNALYNIAEAYFWQGNYHESLDAYRDFLRHFPDHEHGGYAMTRIGELMEILAGDSQRALGAYLESQFRYRDTPGSNIARIRTLVSRMPEMKEKELKSGLDEINELAARTKLPGIMEFAAVAIADGRFGRKDYHGSTAGLVSYYQQNPNSSNYEKFHARIVRNITEAIRTSVVAGNFIEALRLNSLYSTTWLKNNDRIDLRYYIGQAYEQAGVVKEAAKVYRESLNKLYAMRGTSREKERNVFEDLPEADALNLRLAAVASRNRDYPKAVEFLKAIGTPPSLLEKELIERAEVSADVAEARGQIDEAQGFLEELVNTWRGQPTAVAGVYLRLAKLKAQTKNYGLAEEIASKILLLEKDSELVGEDIHAQALELKAEMLLHRGEKENSVAVFRELLELYEGKRPLSAIRYKAGKILFEKGDYKGAETIWNDLKDPKSELWRKLAKEQLDGAKWRGDYKKYIERIPAMQKASR